LKLFVCITIPEPGIKTFRQYESIVLPLLAEHEGTLLGQYRTESGTEEFHVVEFAAEEGFEQFEQDPRRLAASPMWHESGASATITEIFDVD